MISEGSKPVKIFTAVKRKKLRHFRFFGALNFESVETFTSVKFTWKRSRIRPDKPNFVTGTSFWTQTQRKKLKFSRNVTFCGKSEVFHICLYFSVQIYGGNCSCVVRLTAVKPGKIWLQRLPICWNWGWVENEFKPRSQNWILVTLRGRLQFSWWASPSLTLYKSSPGGGGGG